MTIRPVKVVTASDLEENGGVYLVQKGIPALPVWGFTNQGNQAVSRPAQPVYVVTEAEFNAGDFVKAHGQPLRVGDIGDLGYVGALEGREAVPVWAVNDWPGGALDAEYEVYEAAMVTPPSPEWQAAANQLFVDLKAALGVSSLTDALDFMYLLAAETEQAGLLNAVNPGTFDATNVDSMAFEASRGMTGNGTSSYLNTNYNPSTQGINYLEDSAVMGFYSRTNLALNAYDMGALGGTNRDTRIGARVVFNDAFQGNININANTLIVNGVDSSSLLTINRSAESLQTAYRAGVSIGSFSQGASVGVPANNFFIGSFNNSGSPLTFTTRQYSLAFTGGSMDATQQAAFFNAIETFMDAIGAGVSAAPAEEPNVVFEPLTEVDELGGVLLAQQGVNPTANFGAYAGR